jgi:hypothetical protein
MKHPCEIIYDIGAGRKIYGNKRGICRIIGKELTGVNFDYWVKLTFNDWGYLKPGDIISNQALFTMDEKSVIIKEKTGKDKLQRFRTYSHIVWDNKWFCVTKADKKFICDAIVGGAKIVSLTDTGQKHIFFKHRPGMWQLDELFVQPDIETFTSIHSTMCDLLRLGFSQAEVVSGEYKSNRIILAGPQNWRPLEFLLKSVRGSGIFDFAAWLLFISEQDKQNIQAMYAKKKQKTKLKKEQLEL